MNEDLLPFLEVRYQRILKSVNDIFLRVGRSRLEKPITLIAVSKTQSIDAIQVLYQLGHRHFGENYVQELEAKAKELERRGCPGIYWHFIGHLQSNKVKNLLPYISFIHTVDSVKLALALSNSWSKSLAESGGSRKLPVFLQINIDREETKSGFLPEEILKARDELAGIRGLEYLGLMCIPSPTGEARLAFHRLRDLEQRLRPLTQGKLSMGMSGDFETAIQEGATHIRVGTALFGERSKATGQYAQ